MQLQCVYSQVVNVDKVVNVLIAKQTLNNKINILTIYFMFLLLDVHAFGLAYGSELLKPFIDVEKIAYLLAY